MDHALRDFLAELMQHGREHDARTDARQQKLLNLDPDTASFVHLLIRLGRRTRVLEIGTSNGYSTIWLADAARTMSGRVTSLDRDKDKHALANANLKRAGLRELVELRVGDATEMCKQLTGPFDCVFFDADRTSAPDQLQVLLPKLTGDVLLLADNALSHPDEIASYLEVVRNQPGFEHVVVPVGKGLSVAHRGRPFGTP